MHFDFLELAEKIELQGIQAFCYITRTGLIYTDFMDLE